MSAAVSLAIAAAGLLAAVVMFRRLREHDSRRAAGMPSRHPERLSGSDRAARGEGFRLLAAELWPDGEWAAVIEEHWRERS